MWSTWCGSAAETMPNRRQAVFHLLGLAALTDAQRLQAANPFPPLERRTFSVPSVDGQGQVVSRYHASALHFVDDLGAAVKLDMALIQGGDFAMGSPSQAAPLKPAEQPIHRVSIRSFAIGVCAVTRGIWRQVSTFPQITRGLHALGNLPSEADNSLPVERSDMG